MLGTEKYSDFILVSVPMKYNSIIVHPPTFLLGMWLETICHKGVLWEVNGYNECCTKKIDHKIY